MWEARQKAAIAARRVNDFMFIGRAHDGLKEEIGGWGAHPGQARPSRPEAPEKRRTALRGPSMRRGHDPDCGGANRRPVSGKFISSQET